MDVNHMLAPSASALVGNSNNSSKNHQNHQDHDFDGQATTHNQTLNPSPPTSFSSSQHDNAVFNHNLPPLASVTSSLPSASVMAASTPMTIDQLSQQLPPIKSLAACQQPPLPMPPPPAAHKPDNSPAATSMDLDASTYSIKSAPSPAMSGRSGSVNIDDPDVRLAAEALEDLRADFVSSPATTAGALSPPAQHMQLRSQTPQGSEPLLSLLTTSHPLLASTIEGASSAYGGAKNFSPRFKSSAEYVEGYLTPIANTVGSVGRVTGVEGGVRWFLGAGRRGNSDAATGSKKRRKVDPDGDLSNKKRIEADGVIQLPPKAAEAGFLNESFPSTPKGDRRLSMASTVDTLPAYDDVRSPAYTETAQAGESSSPNPQANPAWQSRLIMSTSGLSVAMSDESLRSLKYCLRWLRWANEHIGGVVGSLKHTLDEYDREADKEDPLLLNGPEQEQVSAKAEEAEKGEMGDKMEESNGKEKAEPSPEPSKAELANRIDSLKGDVVKTLQDAVNMVSRYAGGALPDNARVLVRRHLTSLPARWRLAMMNDNNNQNTPQEGESSSNERAVRDGAQKILVLAKEGLDMVTQVSGVLDGTIVSAEEWCERMGRRRRSTSSAAQPPVLPQVEPSHAASPDVHMNGQ